MVDRPDRSGGRLVNGSLTRRPPLALPCCSPLRPPPTQLVRMKAGQGTKSVRYEIMPTHAAGTLLVRNRHMMGRNAMTDLFRPTDASDESNSASTSSSNVGGSDQSGATGPTSTMEPEHLRITPLACVSLFEHVYLPKYGVNGKEDYVRDWIRHLDWKSIEKA